jgi:hypothetical protein
MATRLDLEAISGLLRAGDYLTPYAIRAVCLTGIADHLADGPLPVGQLAKASGTQPEALATLLRHLACRGIFAEPEPGTFALTPMADLLRTGHPYSAVDIFRSPVACTRAMEGLDHTLRTGEAAFDAVHGHSMWQHLATHPDDGERFDHVMGGVTALELRVVLRALDWSASRHVTDVGGGNGSFLARLLGRFPRMRGTLFDLPGVVANAPAVLASAGVADRCTVTAGSFLADDIPAGADAYLLKRILYSWSDQQVVGILSRVRAAMPATGRVLIMEAGRPEENAGELARRMDLLMLTLSAGGARSLDEQADLLDQAGLAVSRVIPTAMFPIIEAVPS